MPYIFNWKITLKKTNVGKDTLGKTNTLGKNKHSRELTHSGKITLGKITLEKITQE